MILTPFFGMILGGMYGWALARAGVKENTAYPLILCFCTIYALAIYLAKTL